MPLSARPLCPTRELNLDTPSLPPSNLPFFLPARHPATLLLSLLPPNSSALINATFKPQQRISLRILSPSSIAGPPSWLCRSSISRIFFPLLFSRGFSLFDLDPQWSLILSFRLQPVGDTLDFPDLFFPSKRNLCSFYHSLPPEPWGDEHPSSRRSSLSPSGMVVLGWTPSPPPPHIRKPCAVFLRGSPVDLDLR